MQWNKEANGALRDPLADPVTSALFHASDQGGFVDYAIKDLAFGRFGCAHSGGVGARPGRKRGVAHGDLDVRGQSECRIRCAEVIEKWCIYPELRFTGLWGL